MGFVYCIGRWFQVSHHRLPVMNDPTRRLCVCLKVTTTMTVARHQQHMECPRYVNCVSDKKRKPRLETVARILAEASTYYYDAR